MAALVVIITDTEELARTLDRYLRTFLGSSVDVCYMTYGSSQLSPGLIRQTDLFLLEIFRRDALGYRAEGLYVAERFAAKHKRVLLFSGDIKAEQVDSDCYWDLASQDRLCSRIDQLLGAPPQSPLPQFKEFKQSFKEFCRPAPDTHHSLL